MTDPAPSTDDRATTRPSPNGPAGDPLLHDQRRARRPSGASALRRSREHRWLGGIAGGIASFTGAPVAAVRWVIALSVPLSLGITAVGYGLLWLLIPSDAS